MASIDHFVLKRKFSISVLILEIVSLSIVSTSEEFSSKSLSISQLNTTSEEKFNILGVFGHPGKSHFDFFEPLLEELARRGHKMTVMSYFPRNPNITSVEVLRNYKDINLSGPLLNKWINRVDLTKIDYSIFSSVRMLFTIHQWALDACQAGLNIPEVRKLIKSDEKFDLIITEFFNTDCFLGFVHKFKAPFIGLSPHQIMPWHNYQMRNPDNPSYVPVPSLEFPPQMNFLKRSINTIFTNFAKVLFNTAFQWSVRKIVEEAFGPDVPPFDEITTPSALLANIHYSLFGARPHAPNVLEVGGLHIRPVKPLREDIKNFLDEATEGALLFSWGSMVKASTLPKKKLNAILRVIRSIPRKVIWKWEIDELPQRPDNLMIVKWFCQADIISEYKCT